MIGFVGGGLPYGDSRPTGEIARPGLMSSFMPARRFLDGHLPLRPIVQRSGGIGRVRGRESADFPFESGHGVMSSATVTMKNRKKQNVVPSATRRCWAAPMATASIKEMQRQARVFEGVPRPSSAG